MKQTAVEWLFSELKNHLNMPPNHANEILEQAKELEEEQTQNLNLRWAKSREKTREVATRIAFNKGFESGLLHYDTYYEELNATQLDEDDFHKRYVSLTFNENFTSNEK